MELGVADGAAGITEETGRVLAALELREGELAEAMLAAILGEIGSYDRPSGEALMRDVREHCRLHVDLLMRSLRAGRDPDRSDLSFARDAAARRVHQGIPLDGLLQAFRVGHRTLWQAIVDEASNSPAGREAAIRLAGEAMEYIDLASTHVAEAYLRESGQLAELVQRRHRDLLENLLAGQLPDETETETLGLGPGSRCRPPGRDRLPGRGRRRPTTGRSPRPPTRSPPRSGTAPWWSSARTRSRRFCR